MDRKQTEKSLPSPSVHPNPGTVRNSGVPRHASAKIAAEYSAQRGILIQTLL